VWGKDLKVVREIPLSISAGIHIKDNSCFVIIGERGPPGGSIQVVNKANWSKMRDFDFGLYQPNDMVTSETHCIVPCGGQVNVVDLDRMQQTATIEATQGVPCVAVHDNNVLFYDSGNVKVYDLAASKQLKRFECAMAHRMTVSGDTLFVGGDEGPIQLFDLKTYKEVVKMEGHREQVTSLCVDGSVLYSGGDSLKMWDLTRNALVNSVAPKDIYSRVGAVGMWNGKLVTLDNPDVLIWE